MTRRIFWDSMLLIYLLEGNPRYRVRVQEILTNSYTRGDALFTSFLGLGEVMVGAASAPRPSTPQEIRAKLDNAGFSYLEFGEAAVNIFVRMRAVHRVKSADSIHLACAAAAGIDLFLTGDKQLMKLNVPGIRFIADFENPIL
jgi:predicted nucleic acid-binding protein